MRHSDQGGKFDIPFEQHSIYDGIDGDLRSSVGQHVLWVTYDPTKTVVDEIYDVASNDTGGRRWNFPPIRIPAYAAFVYQGQSTHNDRGFYNSDILRVSVAMNVIEEIFPELIWEPDNHIKDRVLYRGHVYVPTRTYLRGLLRDTHTIFTIDANQVNPEEYVNDPDLLAWVHRSEYADPPMPYAPNLSRRRTTL